jgi:hypothetical protein
MRVALATACGARKRSGTWPVYQLYKSPRIKGLYNRKNDFPLFIRSAEYGLIDCHTEISSYERVMNLERALELAPSVADVMGQFDIWVHFKAGARSEYSECIKTAGTVSGVPLVLMGFANMGCLHECVRIAALLRDGKPIPSDIRSLELHGFKHY